MEEAVGKLWHRLITRTAEYRYPEAAVTLKEMERTAGVLFRAMGGDNGLRIAPATVDSHTARRGWLARIAGAGERANCGAKARNHAGQRHLLRRG